MASSARSVCIRPVPPAFIQVAPIPMVTGVVIPLLEGAPRRCHMDVRGRKLSRPISHELAEYCWMRALTVSISPQCRPGNISFLPWRHRPGSSSSSSGSPSDDAQIFRVVCSSSSRRLGCRIVVCLSSASQNRWSSPIVQFHIILQYIGRRAGQKSRIARLGIDAQHLHLFATNDSRP